MDSRSAAVSRALLAGKDDRYGGFIIDPLSLPANPLDFDYALQNSLALWKSQGKKCIWLKLSVKNANLVPLAIKEGFCPHHAEKDYIMMTFWIPEVSSTFLANASHQVGVGAIIINNKKEHADLRANTLPYALPRHRSKYYPSNKIDWQPVKSISGIFDAFHAYVRKQLYKGRTHRDLADHDIFFYDLYSCVPKLSSSWDHLNPLPLPSFESKDWSLSCAQTSESYRSKLYQDIQKSLKATIATKVVRLTIFMPFEVFVNFFYDEETRLALTMFISKSSKTLDILENGWDRRRIGDVISVLQKKSIICKYIISSQNFIVTFHYTRYHQVNENLVLLDQDLESDPDNKPLVMEIYFEGYLLTMLNTLSKTSLSQIREDIAHEEIEKVIADYVFSMDSKRVPRRKEKLTFCKDSVSHRLLLISR